MDLPTAMILFKADDEFTDRENFPADVREAYRQGLDDGEILFARRLRAALEKQAPAGTSG
jgi:hypothetical protein